MPLSILRPSSAVPHLAARHLDPAALADLRRRGRWQLLRVIWPFLLAIPLLLALIAASFDLLAAGRAYTEGESLWSKGQKDAVQSLARYHDSCDEADYARYEAAIAAPLGDRQARLALLQPEPDRALARQGLLQGGNHPDEIDGMVFVIVYLRDLPLLRDVVQIWTEADEQLLALTEAAARLRVANRDLCNERRHDDEAMQAIYRINDALTPLQREFSRRLGLANRTIQSSLLVVLMLAAGLLTATGVALSRRVMLRASVAEAVVRQELRRRREALHDLHELLATRTDDARDVASAAPDDIAAVSRAVVRLSAQEHAVNARLQAILGLSPDAFLSFDDQGLAVDISPAFATLTGLDPHALLGRSEPEVRAAINAQILPGHALPAPEDLRGRGEALILPLAGTARRVLSAELREAEPSADPATPHPVHRVLCLRDISREHEIDRLKSEFMTLAAHELRTPMASIHGYVELMLHRSFDEARRRELLGTVFRQSQLMVGIIEDLLDLSRLEARQEQALQREPLDLAELVPRSLAEFPLPRGRDPVLWQSGPASAPVLADVQKLTRVITNLVGNACKFSPLDRPVAVRLLEGSGRWGIEVSDQGIGMSPEQLARLGERFYRADQSGNIPGTGLGVSIVREILNLHGGALEVRSTPGQGSVFTAWLPRQNPPEPPPAPT